MTIATVAIALAGLSASMATIASPPGKTWRLPFWIDGEVEGVADSDVQTHPCGATVLLSVSAIPLGRMHVDTDTVVEFDAAGHVVREWRTPVDYPPVAVDGERLIVSGWTGDKPHLLALLPSGEIGDIAGPSPTSTEAAERQCPAAITAHFGSDYLRCEHWTDRSNGAERLIAFEGPCT